MNYLTVPLDSKHDRKSFSCGKELLDTYFWNQASQDVKRKLSVCFIFLEKESEKIAGYYTLSSNNIPNEHIPNTFRKRLPKSYLSVPAILLGRLAVDKTFQKKGIGKILLIDALKRCLDTSGSIGAYAVIVDPLDEEAVRFYEKYGFITLPDSGKMFLPMKTLKQFFK